MKLTDAKIRSAKHTGKARNIYDGPNSHGLYLRVAAVRGKSYSQRLTIRGKRTDIGLGPYPYVTLAKARQKAFDNKRIALEGGDPRTTWKEGGMRFDAAANSKFNEYESTVTKKAARDWMSAIKRFVFPKIGTMNVAKIGPADIKEVLMPLTYSETMVRKTATRISSVIDWAIANEVRRTGDNPVAVVVKNLPITKAPTGHFAAAEVGQVPEIVRDVKALNGLPAWRLGLQFVILTACRTNEVRLMEWSEVDTEKKIWTVPVTRTKTKIVHRVPLTDAMLAILEEARESSTTKFVFQGRGGKRVADAAFVRSLRRAGYEKITAHGFRSTFTDWCRKQEPAVDEDVRERCLGHAQKSQVVGAYARDDLLAKRRVVMAMWSEYVSPLDNTKSRIR